MSKLEQYLEDLDRALGPLPLSDRIDLLSETKRKALATAALGASATYSDFRRELGEPFEVAAQFLRDRGFHAGKRASNAARNVMRVVLASFALLFLVLVSGSAYLFWRFSPLVEIDEANQHIRLLGGYVDIDGKEGRLRVGENTLNADEYDRTISITKTIEPGAKTFEAQFSQGSLAVAQSTDGKLRIQCRVKGAGQEPWLVASRGKNLLQLAKTQGSKCEIQLPTEVGLVAQGKNGSITLENLDAQAQVTLANGKVEIIRAGAPVQAQVENGRIEFDPDSARAYRYTTQVDVGLGPRWENSPAPDAIPIELTVKRGTIARPGQAIPEEPATEEPEEE